MSVFAKPGQMNHNIQFRHCLYSIDPQGIWSYCSCQQLYKNFFNSGESSVTEPRVR
ncbi:hypothetical protein OROMI_029980 [Orobanche minor]